MKLSVTKKNATSKTGPNEKYGAVNQCWDAGINGLAELVRITGISKSTLEGWHKIKGQVKFLSVIDSALCCKNSKVYKVALHLA